MDKFGDLIGYDASDLAEAIERRDKGLKYVNERHTGVPLAVVTRLRHAGTERERRRILVEARDGEGCHLDPEVQAYYLAKYRAVKPRAGQVKVPRRPRDPFRLDKIALERLQALPETFTVSQVVGTPTRPAWSLLRAWEAAERIAPTGRVGEWRKL